jgi:hypothetical protein
MTLYECHAKGVYNSGRPWSFRQYFNSSATLATVSTDWSAQVTAAWTDGTHGLETLYPTTTSLEGTTTYQLAFTLGPPIVIIAAASLDTVSVHAGTSANDGLPDQDSTLVSLRTATAGPNGRGRTYLPAMDETIVVGDILGSTPATRVTTAMTALRTGMAAAGHVQVLLNRKPTKRDPVAGTTKPVTLCKTDRVQRTQRRRIRKELAQYV